MKKILRSSIYQGKNMFKDIGFSFWSLIYPIILAGFFYTAFSGIMNPEIGTINVGIEKGNQVVHILESIDILNIVEVSSKDVEESLSNEEIDGYIKEDLSLVVDRSDLKQTIIKGILNQIKQTISLNEPLENFDFEVDYLARETQEANVMIVIFYSLIAMVSTYGVFPGIETAIIAQANLTHIGARINVTPMKKSTIVISGVIIGLVINLLSNVLLLLFLQYVLRLNLFKNIGYSSIFIILGNLFGISLGVFIGSSNSRSSGVKTMISIIITLFLSFLAGLMSPDVKILIDKKVPLIGRINPIGIVSNNLYRINLLENTKNTNEGILILIFYSLILMFASYLFLRRREYDSI